MTEEERGLSALGKELREAEVRAQTERTILREYAAIGRDPVYAASGLLLSASLVQLLNPFRLLKTSAKRDDASISFDDDSAMGGTR
jgi:hypothetical protein